MDRHFVGAGAMQPPQDSRSPWLSETHGLNLQLSAVPNKTPGAETGRARFVSFDFSNRLICAGGSIARATPLLAGPRSPADFVGRTSQPTQPEWRPPYLDNRKSAARGKNAFGGL